jgi:hypothetical protein
MLAGKFKLERSFGMSFEGDCHEVEIPPNLKLLVNFDICLEGVCHELCS